jgi:predicted aconitase with swiveling domain
VLPSMIGSSPSSYIMLKLMAIGRAPAALILAEPDAILSFGGNVGRKGVLGEHSVDRRQRP